MSTETITVTFEEKDLLAADQYSSQTDCLMATALKRMGFTDFRVSACGTVLFGTGDHCRVFSCSPEFNCSTVFDYEGRNHNPNLYKPELIGQTFFLTCE